MSLDLTQFHGAFFEESLEALDSMESALLQLDVGAPNPELINTIFRVAHSIKGGSATFGFGEVTSFTHSLETLLDVLRSVDVMRAMLRALQAKQPIDAQRCADLQFDLELLIAGRKAAPPAARTAAASAGHIDAASAAPSAPPRWRIGFRPYAQFFARGNDPLRMFRELASLGRLEVRAELSGLPPLTELDPQSSYLGWSLHLDGEVTEAAIREVFDWATGECDLSIERSTPLAATESAPSDRSTPAVRDAAVGPSTGSDSVPPRSEPVAPAGRPEAGPLAAIGDSGSIRVSVEKIDELMNTVGELVITQAMLSQLGRALEGSAAEQFRSGLAQLERNMRELQESVMRVRMLPISFVFSRFPRMVRDLAHRLGKQVELRVSGEQTELDKTVLEKIGDPLTHLVRNCVDHGIEGRDSRLAAGKSPTGTVRLNACHRGGNIAVEVSDDGAGLDRERILRKARERGLVPAADPLTDEQIDELIFLPGFSTAEQTTDVSGRGVGMDVVRRNIKELGGKVEVRSERGRGSRFLITLPLTLAIVDGQTVAVGTETYIVPLTSIIESLQLSETQVSRVAGRRSEVFSFRGSFLPVIRLHEVFGIDCRAHELSSGLVVVVEGDGRRAGLFVDDLLGQQQVVIKSLETNYGHVRGVSGATILGDGSVALILDVPGLIRDMRLAAAA